MTIRHGRADLSELARKLRADLVEKRKAAPPPLEREKLDAFAYPVGWSHLGEPVTWELSSIADHHAAGQVTVTAPSVETCKRRARWLIADGLMKTYRMDDAAARAMARDAVVSVTTLARRPGAAARD